ncbi:MAG: hypothetical protein OXG95_06360 [Chloroflexi bacterium]|nr:hypothetical protein [Chloroflexota bacterium]
MTPEERRERLAALLLERHDAERDLRMLARDMQVLGGQLRAIGGRLVSAAERREGVSTEIVEDVAWATVPRAIDAYNATVDELARIRAAISEQD